MNVVETRVFGMLIRVRQFGLAHVSSFPAPSRGCELFQEIGGLIDNIENLSTNHEKHSRGAKEKTTQKRGLCKTIYDTLNSLARTARGMERNTPGIQDKFRLPHGKATQEVLAAARAVAAEAELHQAEFIKRGMPDDFLHELVSLIEDLGEIVDSRERKVSERINAKAGVKEAAQRARRAVRELDGIVRNVFAADASVLAEWESASHIERPSRRAVPEEPADAPLPVRPF